LATDCRNIFAIDHCNALAFASTRPRKDGRTRAATENYQIKFFRLRLYVGVELSQAMRRFGSRVTLIDRNERLMSKEDEDVCEAIGSLLENEGIDILLNARINRLSGRSGDSVSIVAEQNGTQKILQGSHGLVATHAKRPPQSGFVLTGKLEVMPPDWKISTINAPLVEVKTFSTKPG
jgi:Pyridine nucleotide-disulphide oxidoreductase